MPSDVAFPKPEKYELKETQSKEDIVSFEAIGIWNDTFHYEKLHFSNGTTRFQEVGIPNVAAEFQESSGLGDDVRYQAIGILKTAQN